MKLALFCILIAANCFVSKPEFKKTTGFNGSKSEIPTSNLVSKSISNESATILLGDHKTGTYIFNYILTKIRASQTQEIRIVDNGNILNAHYGTITGDTIWGLSLTPSIIDNKDVLIVRQNFIAGSVFYIDPSARTNGDGTEANPLNGSSINWADNTIYLFKRGTTLSMSSRFNILAHGVTIGAYGPGDMPILKGNGAIDIFAFGQVNSTNADLTIRDVEIDGNNANSYNGCGVKVTNATGFIKVINCKIHGVFQAVRITTSPTATLQVIGCEFYNCWSDGIFALSGKPKVSANDIEVGYCHIYNVNTSTPNYPDDGDCIHLIDVPTVWIHHNYLDHSSTTNKFCFIFNQTFSAYTASVLTEYNTMKRNGIETLHYITLLKGSSIFRYNICENAALAIQSRGYNYQIYYNIFRNLSKVYEINAINKSVVKFYNNTIYNVGTVFYNVNSFGESVDFKNNIIYTVTSKLFDALGAMPINLTSDYNCYYNITSTGDAVYGIHDRQNIDPLFINTMDFYLKPNSPALNSGFNLNCSSDLGGNKVSPIPNMGARELNTDNNFPLKPGTIDATIANISYTIK